MNPAAVDDLAAFDHAHAESGEVVVIAVVHAGHFGGFAAHQRAAGLQAALGDAGDHRRGDIHRQLAGGVVVEEEQGLGALHGDIVDAHGDEVDADAVVAAGVDGEAQLGAHAIRAGHQHRFAVALRQADQRAKAADPGKHLRAHACGVTMGLMRSTSASPASMSTPASR